MVIGFMVVRFWMVRLVVGFWVVVGFRMQVGFWMVVGLRMQVWVWVVLVVISFMLVFCVVVRWWWRGEVMGGTVVEGVRVWDYLVWMVWLIVSWCLGEVRVIVMVGVGVVSRMGKRVRLSDVAHHHHHGLQFQRQLLAKKREALASDAAMLLNNYNQRNNVVEKLGERGLVL